MAIFMVLSQPVMDRLETDRSSGWTPQEMLKRCIRSPVRLQASQAVYGLGPVSSKVQMETSMVRPMQVAILRVRPMDGVYPRMDPLTTIPAPATDVEQV